MVEVGTSSRALGARGLRKSAACPRVSEVQQVESRLCFWFFWRKGGVLQILFQLLKWLVSLYPRLGPRTGGVFVGVRLQDPTAGRAGAGHGGRSKRTAHGLGGAGHQMQIVSLPEFLDIFGMSCVTF